MSITEIQTDIIVVGAGAAGVAAAIAAAREGKKVILLERNSFAGGRATASAVGTICGLYLRSFKQPAHYVAGSFMKEFAEKLQGLSQTSPVAGANGLYYLPYNPFDFKTCCDEMLAEAGVQVYFHATVYSAETHNDSVVAVNAFVYDRNLKFRADAFVDCSGEATLCFLAGETIVEEQHYQASAQVFGVTNIVTALPESLGVHIAREARRAVSEGRLNAALQWISIVPGSFNDKSALIKIGIPLEIGNDDNKVTGIELTARKQVKDVFDYLKNNIEAFRNSHISFVAEEAGIRTGRRPMGRYTLTENDILECRKFDDGIANGAWPVEFWEPGSKVKMDYFAEDDFYHIPARCLRSSSFSNLLFAGKNISASEKAIASARVIGTCLQTGWAAGKLVYGHRL